MTELKGTIASGFEKVGDAFLENFSDRLESGASFALYSGDELLINIWAGTKNKHRTENWEEDTIAPVFSTTKAIAALIIGHHVSEGKIDYDKPLSDYWPEFGVHGKDKLTVAEALSHQGGVTGFINEIDPQLWLDFDGLSAALADLKPFWEPGTAHGYHPLSFGNIIGTLAKRATGNTIGTTLRHLCTEPNNIDFQIGIGENDFPRIADMHKPQDLPDLGAMTDAKKAAFGKRWSAVRHSTPEWRKMEMPSANGHGNAKSVAKLYSVFANKGKLNGKSVMSDDAFEQMTKPRASGMDLVLNEDTTFAAGVMVNKAHKYGPNENTLGHSGWGGSMGFGDPDNGIAGGYVMNQQHESLVGGVRSERLIKAVYECL